MTKLLGFLWHIHQWGKWISEDRNFQTRTCSECNFTEKVWK